MAQDKETPEKAEKKPAEKTAAVPTEAQIAKKPAKKKPTAKELKDKTPKIKKGRTHMGGKANEINVKPKIRRITHHGEIIESTAVLVYGRMNPPTIGHETLVNEAALIAEKINESHGDIVAEAILALSPTNNERNPLTDGQKRDLVTEAFSDRITIAEDMYSNPIKLLHDLSEQYDKLVWLAGSDQTADYKRIAETYNGKDFDFKGITVVELARSETGPLAINISATKLRQAVDDGNTHYFAEGLAPSLAHKAGEVYALVEEGLQYHRRDKANPLTNAVRDAFRKV